MFQLTAVICNKLVTLVNSDSLRSFADGLTPHVLEEFLRHHVADAGFGAAMTGMLPVIFQVVTVIEQEFLPCPDIARGDDPDMAINELRLAIRLATVIQKARGVPIDAAVQVVRFINGKNIVVAPLTAREGFLFADFLAEIFDDASAGGDVMASEAAEAVDGRGFEKNEFGFGNIHFRFS